MKPSCITSWSFARRVIARHTLAQEIAKSFPDGGLPDSALVDSAVSATTAAQLMPSATDEWSLEGAYAKQPAAFATPFLLAYVSRSAEFPLATEGWLWRTVLIAALQARWELYDDWKHPSSEAVRRLLHQTVYNLRPAPSARAEETTDDEARQSWARLSVAQRVMVSRFLAGVLTDPFFAHKPMADLAAQAIHWRWNDDARAAKAAKDHHLAQRSYRRPTEDSHHIESQIAAIEEAFADTPAPSGALMDSGWDDPAEYTVVFQGTDWRRLTPRAMTAPASCWTSGPAWTSWWTKKSGVRSWWCSRDGVRAGGWVRPKA